MPSTSAPSGHPYVVPSTGKETPIKKDEAGAFSLIRKALEDRGISNEAQQIIINSWRRTTRKQYQTYLKQWFHFCEGKHDPFKPLVATVIAFLSHLYSKGITYSAIGIARSAICGFVKITSNVDLSNNNLISRFMKGVFNTRPALPRYKEIWDVRTVLDFLSKTENDTLLFLAGKLSMLFLLLSAQRCQTLHLICLEDINISDERLIINTPHLLKTSKPGRHQTPFLFDSFKSDKRLCIVSVISEYLQRTKDLRNTNKLLISTVKPHGAVSKQTICRWIKLIMHRAGVHKSFKPHSTRAAASSIAHMRGVPLQTIIESAGWSNAKTFAKYYDKPVSNTNGKSMQAIIDIAN